MDFSVVERVPTLWDIMLNYSDTPSSNLRNKCCLFLKHPDQSPVVTEPLSKPKAPQRTPETEPTFINRDRGLEPARSFRRGFTDLAEESREISAMFDQVAASSSERPSSRISKKLSFREGGGEPEVGVTERRGEE